MFWELVIAGGKSADYVSVYHIERSVCWFGVTLQEPRLTGHYRWIRLDYRRDNEDYQTLIIDGDRVKIPAVVFKNGERVTFRAYVDGRRRCRCRVGLSIRYIDEMNMKARVCDAIIAKQEPQEALEDDAIIDEQEGRTLFIDSIECPIVDESETTKVVSCDVSVELEKSKCDDHKDTLLFWGKAEDNINDALNSWDTLNDNIALMMDHIGYTDMEWEKSVNSEHNKTEEIEDLQPLVNDCQDVFTVLGKSQISSGILMMQQSKKSLNVDDEVAMGEWEMPGEWEMAVEWERSDLSNELGHALQKPKIPESLPFFKRTELEPDGSLRIKFVTLQDNFKQMATEYDVIKKRDHQSSNEPGNVKTEVKRILAKIKDSKSCDEDLTQKHEQLNNVDTSENIAEEISTEQPILASEKSVTDGRPLSAEMENTISVAKQMTVDEETHLLLPPNKSKRPKRPKKSKLDEKLANEKSADVNTELASKSKMPKNHECSSKSTQNLLISEPVLNTQEPGVPSGKLERKVETLENKTPESEETNINDDLLIKNLEDVEEMAKKFKKINNVDTSENIAEEISTKYDEHTTRNKPKKSKKSRSIRNNGEQPILASEKSVTDGKPLSAEMENTISVAKQMTVDEKQLLLLRPKKGRRGRRSKKSKLDEKQLLLANEKSANVNTELASKSKMPKNHECSSKSTQNLPISEPVLNTQEPGVPSGKLERKVETLENKTPESEETNINDDLLIKNLEDVEEMAKKFKENTDDLGNEIQQLMQELDNLEMSFLTGAAGST